ncbi:SwmB domain-containing protein, partial [Massilia oculi]|uniref:SwmB domain-containing protein n=1 Tax=Massilia oculi TaxID=945844 RepID=UPI0028A93671
MTSTSSFSLLADTNPPRLLSVKLHDPATRVTNADSLTWRVTFSEKVQNLDPSDFLATVTTATVTGLAPVDDYTYEVTVSGGDLASRNGTITLQLAANHDVSDLAGNPVANRQGDIEEWYNLDNLPPSVAAISRFEPAGAATDADSVTWRVQFTENVTDVDIDDFEISGTSATITRFARPFGIIADITISGGDLATMDGLIKLGFAPDHEIYDQAGNRLVSTAPLYGDQSSYTIDNTAPRVTSIVRQSPLDAVTDADELVWRVTFSEAVSNLDRLDFTVSGSTAGVTAVTPAGGNAWDVKVAGGDLADYVGVVTLGFAAGQDVVDVVGHALNPAPSSVNESSYTIQPPPPSPPSTAAGALAFSNDTGVLGNDLVTRVGVQTVSGSLSAGLRADEWVQVSLDGGQNWQTASAVTGDTTWELAGQVLTGSGTLQVKVSNAGGDGPVASRAYVLDTAAPPLSSVSVDGASVTLVYGEALGLAPALELFTVSAGGIAATISGLALDAAGTTLTLTLAAPVLPGQAVTLSYRAPDFGREQDAVQDRAGNGVAPFSDYAIANLTQDTIAPTLVSSTVEGTRLVLVYDEALDAVHPPLARAFTVTVDGAPVAVNVVAVDSNAAKVTLTLASAVQPGQAVTLSYRDPTAGDDQNAIQDLRGNDAASLDAHAVGNDSVDTLAPAFVSASVNGAVLEMRYSEALDADHPPPLGAFTVLAGGVEVVVNAVAVGAAGTLTLTLAAPVAAGQAVTVAYRDPTTGDDLAAIQDAAGNDAASLAATAVQNATSTPPTPNPPAPNPPDGGPVRETVDGVRITKEQVANADGSVSTRITVPVLTAEMAGADGVADIPLVAGPGGTALLAQVPAGFGLSATGAGVKNAGSALADLVREVRAHMQAPDQAGLIDAGGAFLASLPAASQALVHTVAPVVAGDGAPEGALAVTGDARTSAVLVIDGGALPQGAAIVLEDVELAIVGGAVAVTAGAGTQRLLGDGAGQTFIVGEGATSIDGGAGRDTVQFGGAGRADYSLRVKDGQLVVSGEAAHTDANVEVLRFVS